MLEQWRVWQAHIVAKGDVELETYLLEQHIATQRALGLLGIAAGVKPWTIPPGEIPGIGEVVLGIQRPDKYQHTLVFDAVGLPGTGKTKMIERYMRSSRKKPDGRRAVYVREGAANLDRRGMGKDQFGAVGYHFLTQTEMFAQIAADIGGKRGSAFFLSDRGPVDWKVRTSAFALSGHISERSLLLREINNDGYMLNGFNRVIIQLFSSPEMSMTRKHKWEKPGRVVNMPNLRSWYDQALRYHSEWSASHVFDMYVPIDANRPYEQVYTDFAAMVDLARAMF